MDTLQVVHVSFIDTQFIQSKADLLFSVTIADRPGYVYFLFEHQSSPDDFMMLRLLVLRFWEGRKSRGGWKGKYEAVFKNKLTDAMQEASETQCWLEFAQACKYITPERFQDLDHEYERIIAMFNGVEKHSSKFCY